MAEFPELNDLDFLAADFELIDNTNSADLELFAIMSENTWRTLLEEANNTVSEKQKIREMHQLLLKLLMKTN